MMLLVIANMQYEDAMLLISIAAYARMCRVFLSYEPCLAGVSKLESLMPTAFNQCWFAHGLVSARKPYATCV